MLLLPLLVNSWVCKAPQSEKVRIKQQPDKHLRENIHITRPPMHIKYLEPKLWRARTLNTLHNEPSLKGKFTKDKMFTWNKSELIKVLYCCSPVWLMELHVLCRSDKRCPCTEPLCVLWLEYSTVHPWVPLLPHMLLPHWVYTDWEDGGLIWSVPHAEVPLRTMGAGMNVKLFTCSKGCKNVLYIHDSSKLI